MLRKSYCFQLKKRLKHCESFASLFCYFVRAHISGNNFVQYKGFQNLRIVKAFILEKFIFWNQFQKVKGLQSFLNLKKGFKNLRIM